MVEVAPRKRGLRRECSPHHGVGRIYRRALHTRSLGHGGWYQSACSPRPREEALLGEFARGLGGEHAGGSSFAERSILRSLSITSHETGASMSSPTWSRPRRWLARAPQDCVDPGDRDLFVVKRLAHVVVGAFDPFRRARLPTPTPNGQRQVPPRRPGGLRPYDLRHSFASLLFHEGHLSIVEIAAQARPQPDDDTRHLCPRDGGAERKPADRGRPADQGGEKPGQDGPQKDPAK